VREMEFQPDPGNFLYLSFVTKESVEDDKETHETVSACLESDAECGPLHIPDIDESEYYFGNEYTMGMKDTNDE
jgi:hypothetical protein